MNQKPANFSPGKVIISGEHSVVYGQPAIVGGVSLGISVEVEQERQESYDNYLKHIFDIFIDYCIRKGKTAHRTPPVRRSSVMTDFPDLKLIVDSTLPQKSGLGSSAAFAHAVFLGLKDFFKIHISQREMFELVWLAEKYIHGNSSGIDPAAVVYGGLIHYEKSQINSIKDKPFSETEFLLVDSGGAEESTGEMVGLVGSRQQLVDSSIEKMGQITSEIFRQMNRGFFDYSLLSENQKLLEDIGVVGEKAKGMVRKIESFGGVSKVTGAGGVKSGSGFLLSWHERIEDLVGFVENQNWSYKRVMIG